MKRHVIVSCLLLAAGLLFAEVQPANRPSDSPFSEDAGYYYASGDGKGPAEEEALRLAKSAALARIFKEIGKDELFIELFLSSWPEAVKTERSSAEKVADGSFAAKARIQVDRNALMLTEQPYRSSAAALLDKAEKLLAGADLKIGQGKDAESALRLPEAFVLYRQGRGESRQAAETLKPLGDNSLLSEKGTNLASLRRSAASLVSLADEGITRIEAAEKKTAAATEASEAGKVLDLLETEAAELAKDIEPYRAMSPFYDLPAKDLESIRSSLGSAQNKNSLILERLAKLRASLPESQAFLRQRADFLAADMESLAKAVREMKGAAEEELRYPRLARQEDARRSKERREAVKWVFLHKPYEYLTLRYEFPLLYSPQDGFESLPALNGQLRLEGSFKPGVWLRTSLEHQETDFGERTSQRTLHQEVAVGLFDKTLYGIGFGWDWMKDLSFQSRELETVDNYSVKLYYGKIDPERYRPYFLAGFSYQIPRTTKGFVVPYLVNGALDLRIKAEDYIFVEGSVASRAVQTAEASRASDLEGKLSHVIEWKVGLAFRLPAPFAWGVSYQGGKIAPIDADGKTGSYRNLTSGWSLFFEYAL